MRLLQVARKILEQAANQKRIAVADLARLRRLVRRNNFVAGREMKDAQSRADERIHVSRRCQQRQRAGVQFCAGLQQRFARRKSSPRKLMFVPSRGARCGFGRRCARHFPASRRAGFRTAATRRSPRARLRRFSVGAASNRRHEACPRFEKFPTRHFAKSRSHRASSGRPAASLPARKPSRADAAKSFGQRHAHGGQRLAARLDFRHRFVEWQNVLQLPMCSASGRELRQSAEFTFCGYRRQARGRFQIGTSCLSRFMNSPSRAMASARCRDAMPT